MAQEQIDKVIVGLGNPGKPYHDSRHNIGFMVVDYLTKSFDVSRDRVECNALTRLAPNVSGKKVLLVKPATFMNNSGQAVSQLFQKYGLVPSQLLVLHDDLDLPFSQIRFKSRGQSGGHRGIESIIGFLHTDVFTRLKIGIDRPALSEDAVEYVLSPLLKWEWKTFHEALPTIQEAIILWIEKDFHIAANRFNRKAQTNDE